MDEANKQYFFEILTKYRLGNASKEEIKFLESYYDLFELNDDLITDENEFEYVFLKSVIKKTIDEKIAQHEKKTFSIGLKSIYIKYAIAASILFFLSITTYIFVSKNNKPNIINNAYKGIVPGGNKAMLTLANGTKITLDDASKGEIAKQAGASITKTADGHIVYRAEASTNDAGQNTVATPRGGQYKITLPDGTNVWLNAASSLTYPTTFNGTERLVTLKGEAYFEVAKNKQMPFRVKSAIQTIEVLGTHFNINAYADENAIKTTLLEGSVKVSSASNSSLIVPGEQAIVNWAGNGSIARLKVNLDKETAWKNGIFSFENDDLKSVMRQICRWYNIDVVYEGHLPPEKYFGEISRNSSLTEVFRILELNNLKFNVEGKTVKVSYDK